MADEYNEQLNQSKALSEHSFNAYVVTPYETFYSEFCEMLVLPTADGEIGVMYGHTPLVTAIYPGELRINKDGAWKYAFVSNGYAQIEGNYVMVVCNSAEWEADIDVPRAEEALKRAEVRYRNEEMTVPERKRAAHAIRRAKKRIMVAKRSQERQAGEH